MAAPKIFPLATLVLFLTFSQVLCSTPSQLDGLSLRLIPRDSPESPIYPGNLTALERMQRMINFTNARAYELESTYSPNSTLDPEGLIFRLNRDSYYYMVQLAIGNPELIIYLLVDTGSGLIWTQCQPCTDCYLQDPRFPIYNSLASRSYTKLTCDHPLCNGPNALFRCVNNECLYNIGYSGGATTEGVASQETFKFIFDNGSGRPKSTGTIVNIVFGCSHKNQNIQFGKNGVISGILGLSKSRNSFISQLFDTLGKRFSYCFLPFNQALATPSALRFGQDVPQPGNVQTIHFLNPPGSAFYYLNLLDISVGQNALGFPPGTFAIRPDGSGGCIVDSGALIPKIDQNTGNVNAYRRVLGAFQRYYDGLSQLQRIRERVPQGFQLCYRKPQDFRDYIGMTYHFEGANYVVDPSFVNFYDEQYGYFCVALLPGSGKSVLGGWHQQNMRLIYDISIDSLQFAPEDCSRDVF